MTFLLAFGFILFGLLSLVLGGVVWSVLPNEWQLVGVILTAVGIVAGIPVLLQMTIGRAKLVVEFERIVEEEKRSLAIFMKNPQLGDATTGRRPIWRKIGVKRESIESLIVSFRITEVGTGKILIPIMQARIYSDADSSEAGSWRVPVPPTLSFETTIMVAMWNESKKVAVVPGDRLRAEVELTKGVYRINAAFVVDGETEMEVREFIVGDTADELNWVRRVAS